MSTLSLTLTNGFLHKNYDMIGKMQNYVYLKLTADGRTQEYKTKIVPGQAKKPIVWNQTVNINLSRNSFSNAKLEIELRDQDMTSDQVCGKGFINLEHCGFFQQAGVSIPYSIRLYGQQNQVSGELNFTSVLK